MDHDGTMAFSIAVTGHDGTGRDTVAAALSGHFDIPAYGPAAPPARRAAADLLVHVLGAVVRPCDRDFLHGQVRPVLVVAGKADLRGPRAAPAAGVAAEDLRRPVHPVSALLATVTVDDALLADLRRWARGGIVLPSPPAAFVETPDPEERCRRAAALDALGAAGLRTALAHCATVPDGRDPAAERAALTDRLRADSGFAALAGPLRAVTPALDAHRAQRRRRAWVVQQARWTR